MSLHIKTHIQQTLLSVHLNSYPDDAPAKWVAFEVFGENQITLCQYHILVKPWEGNETDWREELIRLELFFINVISVVD